jgi:hypothetical protein
MSAAVDLLDRLADIGAKVQAVGNQLLVQAGPNPIPGQLVLGLREAKAEVLAALAALERDADLVESPVWWRREFTVRTLGRMLGNRSLEEAERLAFEYLIVEWHRRHCQRVPEWQCAGCGNPIGGLASLDFQDGNRVHFDELDCLIRYGERWRGAATRALVAMGLQPPAVDDPR